MNRLFAGTPFDIPPLCDDCGKMESECICSPVVKRAAELRKRREADRLPPEKQTARVSVQKRKGGRKVTVVEGLTAKANDLAALLQHLQAGCGAGGTFKAKDDTVELQGDHADHVRSSLRTMGYQVKGA